MIRDRTVKGILTFLYSRPDMLRILQAVEALSLPDCWIGAGFIRNAVWDALSGRPRASSWDDVDVIYFCRSDSHADRDQAIERALRAARPDVQWSVKNQARMHFRNKDRAYTDTEDALRHRAERCTAIAARHVGEAVELLTPFGVEDVLDMLVRPTPAFASKMGIYRSRIEAEGWQRRWPSLLIDYSPP
jgi:uncharacterized protein